MQRKYKRRNYFIKKNFQGKLILGYFLFVVGGCLFFIVLLGMFSADSLTINYKNHDLQLGQTPMMLIKDIIKAHWIFIVLGGTGLVIGSMFITHKIAGPHFRLERALSNMIDGNLNDVIYLRSTDEGKILAEKINNFNKTLSVKLGEIDKQRQAIDDLYHQYNELPDGGQGRVEEITTILQAIKKKNEQISEIVNSYTLTDE